MKAVFISYDQALHDNVIEVLEATNVRGYTLFPLTGGRGTKTGDPHLGSHAWPSNNSSIITIVDDQQADTLLARLHKVDEDSPLLGLRAFTWDVEKTI